MGRIIVVLVAVFLLCLLIRAAWTLAVRGATSLMSMAFWMIAGLPFLAGVALQRLLGKPSLGLFVTGATTLLLAVACGAASAGLYPGLPAWTPTTLKYAPGIILLCLSLGLNRVRAPKGYTEEISLFRSKDEQFVRWHFASCILMGTAPIFEQFTLWDGWSAACAPLGVAIAVQLWIVWQEAAMRSAIKTMHAAFTSGESVNATELMGSLNNGLELAEIEALYCGVVAHLVEAGQVEELEIGDERWVFGRDWYHDVVINMERIAGSHIRHKEQAFLSLVDAKLKIGLYNCRDYVIRHIGFGELMPFEEGYFFVSYIHFARLNRCSSCGRTELRPDEDGKPEWYCSRTCKSVEGELLDEARKISRSYGDAGVQGYSVFQGANAWVKGQKMFASGGQGHGFAAEQGNTLIDRIFGRSAKVVGDDNAANGADRMVNDRLYQTKYCRTGARSVGEAFKGQTGEYRYMDDQHKPMALEVPRDQYDAAVKVMARKIEEGKVPGLEHVEGEQAVEEAKKLIVKGHLTYQQAQNITKFCTVESLTYDVAEGAVVGVGAAGISFAITSFVFYVQTKDFNMALRVGVVQAGKTFVRTVAVYVGAQQLHRLGSVQTLLRVIPDDMSPAVRSLLADGFGVNSSAVSKALRGTIVTSAVVIAATTGPDLCKLALGRISGAEFTRRLSLNSSGVTGGVVGGLVGGVAGTAVAGPIGGAVGRFAGGFVGSVLASKVAAWAIPEIDVTEAFEVIDWQVAYLARQLLLGAEEMELVRDKLAGLGKDEINAIHAAANRHSVANAMLKPMVVEVVRARPTFAYDVDDIIEACAEVVG